MEAPRTYTIRATLAGSSHVAGLLRVLTVLHTRAEDVVDLCFHSRADVAVLTGRVTLRHAGPETLAAWLQRPADVLEADVSSGDLDPATTAPASTIVRKGGSGASQRV